MTDPHTSASGWFPDPLGRFDHRYFNGTSWTSDVSVDGRRAVDPLGISPGAGSGGGSAGGSGKNGAATASVIMGAIAVVIAWVPFIVVFGLVLAVLAVVFGVRGMRRSAHSGVGRGSAIAGTVMGGLGIALSIVGIWLSVVVWGHVVDFIEPGAFTEGETTCTVDGRLVEVEGSITNDENETRSYTVFVEVENVEGATAVSIDDVAPGATETWRTSLRDNSSPASCTASTTIQGPFPFGVEVDPVG